jgi:NhaD family Na+/H+ antiporter
MVFFLLILIFAIGYMAIILEHYIKVNKTAVSLFMAVACWVVYFVSSDIPIKEDLAQLAHHVAAISQIIFFLLGAMTIVELVDTHKGFRIITNLITTSSKRKMLWIVSFVTFFLSSVLDNLTTTILMVSLLRKLVPDPKEKFLLCCLVVVAANAGGAWTPIGDVTTTMLWIDGQLSSLKVMEALFIPSLVSLLVPLLYYHFKMQGRYAPIEKDTSKDEPGSRLVFALGVGGLIFVPIFKALTGLPPFMGVLISLSVLWLVTDSLHHKHEARHHLRVPHIFTKIDMAGVLFFLGILLCVGALETAHILPNLATWLSDKVHNLSVIATLIGLFSAVVDNVPLVAATMGMYPLEQFPMDHQLWHMIAYAAGTGGSILIIGSSSGVALMGMEKVDFVAYMKKASIPVLAGFLAGMGVYLFFS